MPTTTPRPAVAPPSLPSDSVQWSDTVSAPIIIPITAAVVVACIILLCIIKCLKQLWDKSVRCDAYEIGDLINEKDAARADIPVLDQSHDLDSPDHPNLNLVNYSGEKKRLRPSSDLDLESGGEESPSRSPSHSGNGVVQRIEAKVHDSSNENNDNDYDDLEDDAEADAQADEHLLRRTNHVVVQSSPNHHSAAPVIVGLETKALLHNHAPLAPTESEV